jgi:hypothetical protein
VFWAKPLIPARDRADIESCENGAGSRWIGGVEAEWSWKDLEQPSAYLVTGKKWGDHARAFTPYKSARAASILSRGAFRLTSRSTSVMRTGSGSGKDSSSNAETATLPLMQRNS